MMRPVVFVLYDSIANSVFDSQIIQPLLTLQQHNPSQKITIISFEKKRFTRAELAAKIPPSISFIQCRNIPFLGLTSLLWPIRQLKKILLTLDSYELIARGPIAGYLAQKAITPKCTQLTVQARGLLAEEYAYTHSNKWNILHKLRRRLFKDLEHYTYNEKIRAYPFAIEVVSQALKAFIIHWYDADPHKISLAERDLPKPLPTEKVNAWRISTRKRLNIPERARVYCYNGSLKPWQCPAKIIAFFKKQLSTETNSYLLVLSQDNEAFTKLLEMAQLHNYIVASVKHADIYEYLSAADVGLLFREKSILNWVSRPTKALEYRAVGLEIMHNNTVAYLKELDQQTNDHGRQQVGKRTAQDGEQAQLT